MFEKDGYVSECEDVSFNRFLPEHAAGLFSGWGKWCFRWEEAGGDP